MCGFPLLTAISLEQFVERLHPVARRNFTESLDRARAGDGQDTFDTYGRFVRLDGVTVWFMVRGKVYFEKTGAGRRPIRIIGAVSDVTELHDMSEEMRIKGKALDSTLTAVVIVDDRAGFVYANPSFVRMWGFATLEDAMLSDTAALIEPDAARKMIRAMRQEGGFLGEVNAVRRDGSIFPAYCSASSMPGADDCGTYHLASFIDLTELKQLQEHILQSRKMESIGRLAGGIAHDFNNLLAVIGGHAEFVRHVMEQNSEAREDTEIIIAAVDSASGLTRQLLSFARKRPISPSLIKLSEIVQTAGSLLQRILGDGIALAVHAESPTAWVYADRSQLEQVIMNLALNARDAMPEGGRMCIRVDETVLKSGDVEGFPEIRPGSYVAVSVSDTGIGMSEDTQEQIFEPFFTTKEIGRGTGLGLAMTFATVSQNGGCIRVESNPGMGSKFTIYLPRKNKPAGGEL